MASRNIESIERVEGEINKSTNSGNQIQSLTKLESVELIAVNYPDPTTLAVIIRDVSRWSGQAFVMEPTLNARIQIFAPNKMSYDDAWNLFLASLTVVNLRAVQIGKIVKIVPSQTVIAV